MGIYENFIVQLTDGEQTPKTPSFLKNNEDASVVLTLRPSPTGQVVSVALATTSVLGGVQPYETRIVKQASTTYATTTSGLGNGLSIITSVLENKLFSAVLAGANTDYAPGDLVRITLANASVSIIWGSLQGFTVNSSNINGTMALVGLKSFTPSGGSGTGFEAQFAVLKVDEALTISIWASVSGGTGYVVGDILYFNEWGQDFYWTLTGADVSSISSSQVAFQLQESNFTDANLSITTILQPGQITTMRASKFTAATASDVSILSMSNKTT